MNYYPNYYPYAGTSPMSVQQQTPALNGKVVDSIDTARVSDVPIGSYGVFPKADLNEIYIKTWNPNGTTNMITYVPAKIQIPEVKEDLAERVSALEEKIDSLLTADKPKKEVKSSGY